MDNFPSLLNVLDTCSMNGTLTNSLSCNNVMSSVGTNLTNSLSCNTVIPYVGNESWAVEILTKCWQKCKTACGTIFYKTEPMNNTVNCVPINNNNNTCFQENPMPDASTPLTGLKENPPKWHFGNCPEISTSKESINNPEHSTRECAHAASFCLGNGTRNECASSIPETCRRIEIHFTAKYPRSHCGNFTMKNSTYLLEHDPIFCVDDASVSLGNGTRNECASSIPEKCSRKSNSTFDCIGDVSKKELQSSLDVFKRNVKRGSHLVFPRIRLTLQYDHHMLVLNVSEDSIEIIEYSSPGGPLEFLNNLFETSLGLVQKKTIKFEELFQPDASKVYLVYSNRYPKTTEQLNAAIERAISRLGEMMYSISHSNCEHFVTWVLEGKSTSNQWRNASVLSRAKGDVLEKLVPVLCGNITDLLLQQKDPDVPPNKDSLDLSPLQDKTIKKSINDTVAPNQKSSKLSTILSRLAAISFFLILAIWGLRPGRHSLMIFAIVVFRPLIFFFGPRFQVLEIDKLVSQNFQNFMSVEDTFREAFKILGICCLWMIRLSRSSTISDTLVLCFCQLLCYILAGILFDVFIYPLFYFLLTL